MTLTEQRQKDPRKVEGGVKGARLRWGPQRIVRLDGLTVEQRRAIVHMIETLRGENAE
jgi:hypothetical protein